MRPSGLCPLPLLTYSVQPCCSIDRPNFVQLYRTKKKQQINCRVLWRCGDVVIKGDGRGRDTPLSTLRTHHARSIPRPPRHAHRFHTPLLPLSKQVSFRLGAATVCLCFPSSAFLFSRSFQRLAQRRTTTPARRQNGTPQGYSAGSLARVW